MRLLRFLRLLILCLIFSQVGTFLQSGDYRAVTIFHLFQIGFLLMNYFRWPTECGISEIIIFAFVLKLIEQEFDKQPEYKRKRKRIEMVL